VTAIRGAAPLLGAVGLLAVAAASWTVGRSALPPPPVGSPSTLAAWADELGPVGAAMALTRLAAAAAAAWLGTAMLVHLTLDAVAPAGPVRARAALLVPATARHAVALLAGVGLGSVSVVTGPTSVLASDPPATATLRDVPPASPADHEPVAKLRSLDTAADTDTDTGADTGAGAGAGADTDAASQVPDASLEVWSVEPGESFWSIATEVLADRWGRTPTDGEVGPYWRALVRANSDRLVTGDPDLLYAGQVLVLPGAP
jgi:nucleoid-associated protein YgaU